MHVYLSKKKKKKIYIYIYIYMHVYTRSFLSKTSQQIFWNNKWSPQPQNVRSRSAQKITHKYKNKPIIKNKKCKAINEQISKLLLLEQHHILTDDHQIIKMCICTKRVPVFKQELSQTETVVAKQ